MAILGFSFDYTGQIGLTPRRGKLYCNDSLATVFATNYLAGLIQEGYSFYPTDILDVTFSTGISRSFGLVMSVSGSSSSITINHLIGSFFSFDVTVGQAALATGGSVTLVTSPSGCQYRVKELQLNSGGTNFSGGGGDRLGQVTDGITVYSVIPAATMQSLANAQWGVTALPNPASAPINTLTAAGTNLVFKYSGGTTDYTAGSLVISGLMERIA